LNSLVGSNDKSISLKSNDEIEILYQANQIAATVLALLRSLIRDGVTTLSLDKVAEEYCRDHGATPAFKGYKGFPASLCTSVNEEVVHGIPSRHKILKNGDIISLDFGTFYNGFYGDAAITVPVGEVKPAILSLLKVTEKALFDGIKKAVVGNRIVDISRAIQATCDEHNYSVVRQFVGHGIGAQLHEPPEVPNYVQRQSSPELWKGWFWQ